MKLLKGKRLRSVASSGNSALRPRSVHFSGLMGQHRFRSSDKGGGNVAPFGVCYSPSSVYDGRDRGSRHAFVVGASAHVSCLGCWRNGLKRPVLKHGPRSLTCPRVFGWKTRARNESERLGPSRGGHRRPDQTFCDGSAVERACWDPKDGELCLNRVKPEETLVEARSDSDVQIDRRIWV